MATITSAGTNSGLDINKIITDLMAAERKAPTQRLDAKEAVLQAKLSGIGSLKSALSEFQTALASVNSTTSFQSLSATISDSSLFSATTTSVAQTGGYDIKITALAQSQKLVTSTFTTVSDVVGSGTLTFEFGTASGSFVPNKTKTVTIDASHNTLAGVRDAINQAAIGVTANIINDGSGYRLSIGAVDSGAANSLRISVTGDSSGTNTDTLGLSRLAYDPFGTANMTQTVVAQNAALTVDGLAITSASNSVVGVVPGVTLNLKKAQASGDAAAKLTIGRDNAATSTAIESFVTAYNTLIDTSKTLTAYNATTGEKGALLGDFVMRSVTSQIRNILTGTVTGATGTLRSLTDVGISFQRDGSLKLKSSTLQAALTANPQAVASLFTRTASASDSLISVNSFSSSSRAGTYAINITTLAATGVNVAGTIGGATATGVGSVLTGTGAAAGIAIDVSGGATGVRGTVSVSNGIAYQLDNLLSDLLSGDGLISNRTEGFNKEVAQITEQRAALEKRMTALEARYRTQFLAMDQLIGKLNSTSTFLTQQLAANNKSS